MMNFRDGITAAINRCLEESDPDTQDFLLAQHLQESLWIFDGIMKAREYSRARQSAAGCTCGENAAVAKGEVPLSHKTVCPKSDTSC